MSILFSRRCEYALQAVIFVASKPDGRMTSIRELTSAISIPYHFLAKILQDLSHKGLLVSHKGPKGGFALGMPPEEISLFHIVEAIDGLGYARSCVLGFPECSEDHHCSLHTEWAAVRDRIHGMLVGRNIAQLALEMQKPGYPGEAPIPD